MEAPLFPCRRVHLGQPVVDSREIVNKWLESRNNENWVLISGSALASEIHGWTALTVLNRNMERGMMKSNSLDGEFIRLLSGTQHIAQGFSRAGLIKGDEYAWVIDLSAKNQQSDFVTQAESMGFDILDDRPCEALFDAKRLGIETGDGEDVAIGHIHLADIN